MFSAMTVLVLAVVCCAACLLLILPLIFSEALLDAVREASRTMFRFNNMFNPDKESDGKLFARYLLATTRVRRREKDAKERVEIIGEKCGAIRQLTGGVTESHVAALQAAGGLIVEIAERGWVGVLPEAAARTYGSSELLEALSEKFFGEQAAGAELERLAIDNPVDLEQLVEMLLLVIDLLRIRIGTGVGKPNEGARSWQAW